jgi:hypothetical protein
MYIFFTKNASYLQLYDSSSNEHIKELEGDYSQHSINEKELVKFNLPQKDGIFCKFNPYCLHKTIRTDSGCRISIDFRTRKNSCYTLNDEYIAEKDFTKVEMGNPYGLGHYWTISSEKFKNYKEKIAFELKYAENLSNEAYSLRKKYIEPILENIINEKN